MKKLLVSFAAVAAILGSFAISNGGGSLASASGELRVAVACSPLTSSQLAQPGDSQLCRIRFQNRTAAPITDITFSRPTPNTVTARYGQGYVPVSCDLAGCLPFTLGVGQTAYVFEESTFNPYEDGRGLTTVTASGTQGGYPVTASAKERTNLP